MHYLVFAFGFLGQVAFGAQIFYDFQQPFAGEKECEVKFGYYKDQMKKIFKSDEKFEIKGNCASLDQKFYMIFEIQSSKNNVTPVLVYETVEVRDEKRLRISRLADVNTKKTVTVTRLVNGKHEFSKVEVNAQEKKLLIVEQTLGGVEEGIRSTVIANNFFPRLDSVKDKIYLIDGYFSEDKKAYTLVGFAFLTK